MQIASPVLSSRFHLDELTKICLISLRTLLLPYSRGKGENLLNLNHNSAFTSCHWLFPLSSTLLAEKFQDVGKTQFWRVHTRC